MANHVLPRHTTWSQETYVNPLNMPANRYYTPRLYTSFGDIPERGAGRERWFHDYRRSHVAERTLENNLKTPGTVVRPTTFSDKPDRVLGARCQRREAVLYKPNHHLTNRIPDRERERAQVDNLVFQHRQQYSDKSDTLHDHKVPYFHYPTDAQQQFLPRVSPPKDTIGSYPNRSKASWEYTYDFERGPKDYELWWKVWYVQSR